MTSFPDFLRDHPLIQTLPASVQEQVLTQVQGWKYRMGQPLMVANQMPDQVIILYQGAARSLFLDPWSGWHREPWWGGWVCCANGLVRR